MQTFTSYYSEQIYKQRAPDPRHAAERTAFLNQLQSTLTPEQCLDLQSPVQEAEFNSLRRNNKIKYFVSPGMDRLPYEFYLLTWRCIRGLLVRLANHLLFDGTCPFSFPQAIIPVLPKTGDLLNVANYRPISLTNSDYKLITKVVAARTNRVLPSLLGRAQCGFVPGRTILEAIQTMQLLIEYADHTQCDFAKAYDTSALSTPT